MLFVFRRCRALDAPLRHARRLMMLCRRLMMPLRDDADDDAMRADVLRGDKMRCAMLMRLMLRDGRRAGD